MIAAENQWQKALSQRFFRSFRDVHARFGDFLQILCALFPNGHFFRLFYFQVAHVLYRMAQLLDGGLQCCAD